MRAASPAHPPSSPTDGALAAFSDYDRILSGYRHHDFPDLSSRRFAPDTLQSRTLPLDQKADTSTAVSFSFLVVAVGRVLGAYCGCQDLLLAIADPQEDKIIPVRLSWSDGQTWGQVAASVAEALNDSRWPRVHPERLRRALDLAPKQSPALALVSAARAPHPSLPAHFPLAVTVDQDNAELSVSASERLCHPSQCELFLSQVIALAGHAAANPTSPVSSLPSVPAHLLSSYEKRSFEDRCKIYNQIPPTKFATDHLTRHATEQPDNIAVRWYADLSTEVPISSYAPETITYTSLEEKSNKFARWLLQIGLQKGRSVAVCMNRDVVFHTAFIGILRAGGCYVPIDAELPTERQRFIAKDSDAQFILSSSDMPCFSSLGDIAIDVKDPSIAKAIEEQSAESLMVPEPDDLAYILYTSGTTGTPKGCILTHRGLNEAIWALSHFCASAELHPPGRVNYLSIASVAFDVHIAEIFVPLAVGIPILAAPRSLLLEDLPYYIKHLRISHVGIVPSLIEATMGAVREDEESGHASTLRYIASGGEKISDAIIDKWASHPKIRLANFYGPSEVTIGCAARMMDKDTPRANIGHCFANVSAYVVDENMNIILRGGTGELVVEGPLVGRGYVGRPDLTQKVFLKFPDDGTDRWAYRTGDLVRMMPDGTLEIIGRIDTQIKLRGVRIESEGISSILRNAAAPAHTLDVLTILARHPAIGIDQLVSFVAWDPSVPVAKRRGGKPSLVEPPQGLLQRLRAASDRELASYMRPSHIVPLDFIPLSSNGKADAKVLAAFFLGLDMEALAGLMGGAQGVAGPDGERREPTEREKRVIEVLEAYVKIPVERLGPHTNLFECGMDSLAVARFASDLRRAFGVSVSPAQIMQVPVVSGVAALFDGGSESAASSTGADASVALEQFADAVREEVEGVYPAGSVAALLPPLPVQEGVLYRSANAPTMYVQHVLMRLGADVSVSGLRDSWSEVVAQHEILRTVFHFGGQLVQVVLSPGSYQLVVSEMEVTVSDDLAFQRYFTDEQAASISRDLNVGISKVPPVRLNVFASRSSGPAYLVLSIHHALYDGISLPVLLEDLERAYKHQPQLPSAPLRDVLQYLASIDYDAAKAFWSSYLQGFEWNRLLNREASSATPDVVSYTFERPLSELQATAAKQHVTLQALLMCAYGLLLAEKVYNHHDVMFGVIRSGRSIPVDRIESTLCPMITVVPARVRFKDPSRTLQVVQDDNARIAQYEHIPLSRIQKWVDGRSGTLFDTLFSVSFKERGRSELWDVLESQNPEPDYILAVEVVLDPDQDRAVVHAAFTSADIANSVVDAILNELEATAVRIAESSDWTLGLSGAKATTWTAASPPAGDNVDLEDNIIPADVDAGLTSRICVLAAQLLRIDPTFVKPDTSLLSLGLDSIKSVGLSRKCSAEGLPLSSADIMRLATPLRLAAYIQRTTSSKAEDKLSDDQFEAECSKLSAELNVDSVKLSGSDEVKVFPTSVLQAGMLSQTLSSRGRLYVHLFPLRLADGVDLVRLRGAWAKALTLFDVLRTSFHFLPGVGAWAQVVHSDAALQWREAQYEATTNLVEVLNPLLDVTDEREMFRRPPVFFHLLKGAAPGEADRLVLVLHHALYDGLSVAKLFESVEQLYQGDELAVSGQYHQLLPRLLWQQEHGTAFWVKQLRGFQPSTIPRVSEETDASVVHQFSLSIQLSEEEISRACRAAEVTSQCLGQAAFAKLLAVATRRRDVVFGRVVSGRDVPGAEDVIGPMLNTVPCRVLLRDDLRNKALLKAVHGANVASIPWQHASLRSIQRELGVSNLWDSLFVYQPRQESLISGTDSPWAFDTADIEDISIHYPLNIELHEAEGDFIVKAACSSTIANDEGLRDLIESYAAFLVDVVRRPDDPWQLGLPDIPVSAPSLSNGHVDSVVGMDEPADKDGRFERIREILSSITKVPISKIQPSTHLAALGVDSITAVQVVAKARRAGLRITAAEVARSRTVHDLLKKVKEVQAHRSNGDVQSIVVDVPKKIWSAYVPARVHDLVERVTHASAGMEWMIGMWQRSGGSRFQHVFAYSLPPDVDLTRLEKAWNELLRRHAILRSAFAYDKDAGAPRVVIFKPDALRSTWSVEKATATSTSAHDSLTVVQDRMKDLVSHPPSSDYPFTRAILLQSSQSPYLLIHLHHFQYDAWSLQLLVDDLSRLYTGEEARSSNDLDGFIRFTSSSASTEQEQAKYWKTAFPADVTLFPPLCSKTGASGRDVYTKRSTISGAAKLDQRARELSVTQQSVFLACWALVQARRSKTNSPVFSLWHSGRTGDLADVERLAIPCINALPFCVPDAQAANDILALARRIQDDLQARSAVVEQSRLVKVHEWTGRGDKPLSNVFVNIVKIAPDLEKTASDLLETVDVPYSIPDVSIEAMSGVPDMQITKLNKDDIMVDIVVLQKTDEVVMSIEYAKQILDEGLAKQIIEEWSALVYAALSEEKRNALSCACM